METINVRVKRFDRLPRGQHALQKKYYGKTIPVRRVPIIIGYVYEQIDPLRESSTGKWLWHENHITPVERKKK